MSRSAATAAGEKKDSYDDEPDDVAVIKKVAKAIVIHKSSSENFLRAFCLSVSIICRTGEKVTSFCRNFSANLLEKKRLM